MKVKDLIKELEKCDPELEVCVFSEDQCATVEDLSVHEGKYYAPHPGHKLIAYQTSSVFLALNNVANFELDQKDYPLVFDEKYYRED